METTRQRDLLSLLKTLADEPRLTLFGLLNGQEYTVGQMAEKLHLPEVDISRQVSQMRDAGLVQLRMADGQCLSGTRPLSIFPSSIGISPSSRARTHSAIRQLISRPMRWHCFVNHIERAASSRCPRSGSIPGLIRM